MERVSDSESFGTLIRGLRQAKGLTQRELASRLEIDFTYLSKLENDRGEPPGEETVRKIAEILNADPEELLARAGRVPAELRELAREDVEFARFLRQLPSMSSGDRERMYKDAEKRREGGQ